MPIQLPAPKPHLRRLSGPEVAAAIVSCAGASAVCALLLMVPGPLVLPAIGVLATLAAAVVALTAWLATRQLPTALTYWDVAGALTFVGVVATLLSEPELALPLLDNQRTE